MMKRIKDRIDILEREVQQERDRVQESEHNKPIEVLNYLSNCIRFSFIFSGVGWWRERLGGRRESGRSHISRQRPTSKGFEQGRYRISALDTIIGGCHVTSDAERRWR